MDKCENPDCYAICDFCKHYDFSLRYCFKLREKSEPDEDCYEFYCFKKKKDNQGENYERNN